MPLHRVFHPPGLLSAEDKQEISERVTAVYTAGGLPAFYVVVVFTPVPEDSFFVGAKPVTTVTKFVRIVTSHLARHDDTPEQKANILARLENAFAPYIKDRGFDWELHIEQHDRDLWHLNGLAPPLPHTEAEKTWVKLNKAVPFEEDN